MGEVYTARDTRLDRTVALKSLPSDVAQDPERRSRFEREARAIAALSHPHICAIYDVGRHDSLDYLVMELLDGTTLAARVSRGPLDPHEAVGFAIQIADALDKAHSHGIVHRDLKPANIMLTRSGVKLLDFGLAKLRPGAASGDDGLTATLPLTEQGQILGTTQYMAPEQLEGGVADARSDIFAFGAIVFEMLTGRRAFEGSSQAAVIGAILHAPAPAMTSLVPGVPPALERLISVCLAKSPDDRWASIHDVLLQLKMIADAPAVAVEAQARHSRLLAWGPAVFGSLAALAAVLVILVMGSRTSGPADMGLDVLSVLPPVQTTLAYGEAPQISPDGRHVAFVAIDQAGRSRLYVRSRDSLEPLMLPDTMEATMPFWSPDSAQLGFFGQGQLKTIAISGGASHALARAPVPRGGTWNRDGMILFSGRPNMPPHLVPAAGGEAIAAGPLDGAARGRSFPSFLPDGRHYVYLSVRPHPHIRLGSLDSPETRELVRSTGSPAYAAGHLLFRRDSALVAQPFDPGTLQLSGAPVSIIENVGFHPITYQTLVSPSDTGVLAYEASTPGSQLAWFGRQGERIATVTPPGHYNTLCLTADGKRVVYELADPGSGSVDLWALELGSGRSTRLTFDPAVDFYPVCSPAGDEVIFSSLRDSPPNLFRLKIESPGSETPVVRSPLPKIATDWSSDGRVIYAELNDRTNWDVMVSPVSGGATTSLIKTEAEERNARLSPDGRWLAYVSVESGASEVFVQPFPPTGVKWQVSRNGGQQPLWRRDGGELYYVAPGGKLLAVDVRPGRTDFTFVDARVLVDARMAGWDRGNMGCQYAATGDGKRFLISTATDTILPITLVRNWIAALRSKR